MPDERITNKKDLIATKKLCNEDLPKEKVKEYKDRLVKFFSLLIEIDQRNKRKGNETKTN